MQSGFSLAHAQLGHAYLQKNMPSEAIAEFEIGALIGAPSDKGHLAYGYAVVGRREEAIATLATILESGVHHPPFHMALAYVGLGDHEEAFRWLERASQERDPWLTTLNVDRALEALRSDSRFIEMVRRIGVVP